jgi:DNA-binding GntR family transcriptional regulator
MSKASETAYQIIREHILQGHWPPGCQLKEEELAHLCGVSRTPIRDALRRLESDFFIRRESARSYVADWSTADVEDLFALRGMLESHAAARAAERRSDQTLARLKDAQAEIALAIGLGGPPARDVDVDRFVVHNREFHRAVMDAAASERLAGLLTRLVEQPVVMRTALSYSRADLEASYREHADLLLAIEARDERWARAVMTAHIQRAFHVFQQERQRAMAQVRRSAAE